MRVKLLPVLSFTLLVTNALHAQQAEDTVLKKSTIEVLQKYKPEVKKAPKPEWMPQLPPADTSRAALSYEVPQQTLYYSYTSNALRPLAMGKDTAAVPFTNYIKAGAGNLSTLFLDAGIGTIKGENYETAFHLHHESQKGSLPSQQDALSGLEAEGVLRQGENVWHAAASLERNQYFYYGNPEAGTNPGTDSLKQTYTTAAATVDLKSKFTAGDKEIDCTPSIGASVYSARFNTSETNFSLNAPFRYTIDETLEAVATVSADIASLKRPGGTVSNSLAELAPGVILHQDALSGEGILGFALGKGGSAFVLPRIVANYTIPETSLILTGGWLATVDRNTYQELTTENPFLGNNYLVKQNRRDEIFASVGGSYATHITYTVRASWLNYTALPTYLNIPGDFRQFTVAYDNVSAFALKAAARYTEASKWSAGATAEYNNYYTGTLAQAWELPKFKFRGDLSVVPIPKLTITGYAAVLSGISALNRQGKSVTLNPITDIGGNAEYQIVSRLGAFLQLDNLLNSKYERWQGYESYGLNIYGGIRLKF